MEEFSRDFFVKQGREGGKIGGKERLSKISKTKRKKIATAAAKASWTPEARKKRLEKKEARA